ncbi:MAG: hypothetical protein ACM3PD_11510 [Chloroflexota bacterium]
MARDIVLSANQRPATGGFPAPGDKSQSGNQQAESNCASDVKIAIGFQNFILEVGNECHRG